MRLIDWMRRQGVTQTWVALQLGVTQATVNRYALGKRLPTPDVMVRIHHLTKGEVTPSDFYDLKKSPAKREAA